MGRILLVLVMLAGCAGTQPAGGPASQPSAPGKCSACHPAPRKHELASNKWEEFLKNHRRRIRLTEDEKNALHRFLIGDDMPAAQAP